VSKRDLDSHPNNGSHFLFSYTFTKEGCQVSPAKLDKSAEFIKIDIRIEAVLCLASQPGNCIYQDDGRDVCPG